MLFGWGREFKPLEQCLEAPKVGKQLWKEKRYYLQGAPRAAKTAGINDYDFSHLAGYREGKPGRTVFAVSC